MCNKSTLATIFGRAPSSVLQGNRDRPAVSNEKRAVNCLVASSFTQNSSMFTAVLPFVS